MARPLDFGGRHSAADLHHLADRYGTPFFLYDADVVNHRIALVRDSLDGLVEVLYAVKANPNLELLRAVRGVADGLDVSSGGELDQAALAGFDMATVSFAGPAKTRDELTIAIERGVGCISLESMRELRDCVDIAKRRDTAANVAVRVNPRLLNRSFGLKMGGRPIQFGFDEEELDAVLGAFVANADVLRFQGIHVYAGSQCFDVSGVVEGVENTLRIASAIEARTSLACRTINLGGGFGVSHGEDDRELDIKALAPDLLAVVRPFLRSASIERRLVFELGRYLTAPAGIYVTRVISSKVSRGKTFFMTDGGLHHHLAAAGTFGAALRSNYVLRNVTRPDAPRVRCSIAGPSCNPTDLLGVDVDLPRPAHGDLIAVLKAGSYGLTASPLLFLGRQTPAEIVRHQGTTVLGRRPRTVVDFN